MRIIPSTFSLRSSLPRKCALAANLSTIFRARSQKEPKEKGEKNETSEMFLCMRGVVVRKSARAWNSPVVFSSRGDLNDKGSRIFLCQKFVFEVFDDFPDFRSLFSDSRPASVLARLPQCIRPSRPQPAFPQRQIDSGKKKTDFSSQIEWETCWLFHAVWGPCIWQEGNLERYGWFLITTAQRGTSVNIFVFLPRKDFNYKPSQNWKKWSTYVRRLAVEQQGHGKLITFFHQNCVRSQTM